MAYLNDTRGFSKAAPLTETWLAAPLRRIGRGIANGILRMQQARMEGVLHAMTETELKEIGIARADIRTHAATLVAPTAEKR